MPSQLAIVLALIASLTVAPLCAVLAAPVAAGPVLVVVPPWADGAAVVGASGGRLIGPGGRAPFALLAAYPSPAAARSARAHGAWAVFGGAVLAALCGVSDA